MLKPNAIRVEIPVYTDAWMRGDRYGSVVDTKDGIARVLLDKSGKTIKVNDADLKKI